MKQAQRGFWAEGTEGVKAKRQQCGWLVEEPVNLTGLDWTVQQRECWQMKSGGCWETGMGFADNAGFYTTQR